MRLAAVDASAAALGTTVGLSLGDARARLPGLEVRDHDPASDGRWLARLADGCVRYTPMVEIDPPDGLILDIAGCAHLLGNEAGLATDVTKRLVRLGMTVRFAFASNPDAARAFTRYRPDGTDEAAMIQHLPIAALRLDPQSEVGLRRAGLKTVGHIIKCPMASIAARFGEKAVTSLRRLTGEADSPLAPRQTLPAIAVERRFAEPVARTEYALKILGELVAEAGRTLEKREAGGRTFAAMFFRSDGLAQSLAIETSRPLRDAQAAMRLFGERIEKLDDPLDPGFGYDSISLTVPVTEPLSPAQLKLEGGRTHETQIAALVDRLSTRLGRGQVRRFRPCDTHIPEQAQLELPAVEAGAPGQWHSPETGEPPLRPFQLFDPPQPIEVIAEVPDGPPHRFHWRHATHDIARAEGPERIASEWWRRKDMKGVTRDYYRVEDACGCRFWIFRHGLYGTGKRMPLWYMHGVFA